MEEAFEDYDDDDYDNYPSEEEMAELYKKYQGIPVKDEAEAQDYFKKFALEKAGSMSWAVLMMADDGSLSVHPRPDQPCYGEMREYANTHPHMLPESQRSVSKPSDLFAPFPDGRPVALVCALYYHDTAEVNNKYVDAFVNPTSPWKDALKDYELIDNGPSGLYTGVIIKDLNVDPTLMVNLFMTLRNHTPIHFRKFYDIFLGLGLASNVALCYSAMVRAGSYLANNNQFMVGGTWGYMISEKVSLPNFIEGLVNPDISEGGTFVERYAYNRPKLHGIFGETTNNYPKGFKAYLLENNVDLSKEPAAPNGLYSFDLLPKLVEYFNTFHA